MVGHQNCFRMLKRLLLKPRWQVTLDECPHLSTRNIMASGTNRLTVTRRKLSGWNSRTTCSISQPAPATTKVERVIVPLELLSHEVLSGEGVGLYVSKTRAVGQGVIELAK